MKKFLKSLFSLVMVLGLVCVATACDPKDPTEKEPQVTEPEATKPEATKPEATEPEATKPEATEPEATTPEATEPEATKPANLKDYYVVGGYKDSWHVFTEENKMSVISVDDLDASIKANLDTTKKITAVLKLEGHVINADQAWTTNANVNGEAVAFNGGYAVKVVRGYVDEEDNIFIEEQWLPDPHTASVANLTPDTLFIPKWVEKAAENEGHLGVWGDNPVVTAGAGEYTVIFVEYEGGNSFESPKYAMGYIQTKKLEEPKTTAELIVEEHAGLRAGTVETKTEFADIKAVVKGINAVKDEDGIYTVELVVKLENEYLGLTFITDDITGLEVDKEVTFTGTIDHEADAISAGDFENIEIVFANPTVTWPMLGAPTGFFVRGDMNGWGTPEEYELKYNEAGQPEITLELTAGHKFKVACPVWADGEFAYNSELPAQFSGQDGGDITVVTAGIYTLTVVDDKLVIKAGRTGYYVRGSFDLMWNALPDYELRYNAEGQPEITVELAADVKFKVACAVWADGEFAYHEGLPAAFANDNGNIKVVTAGTYVITIVTTGEGEAATSTLVIALAE